MSVPAHQLQTPIVILPMPRSGPRVILMRLVTGTVVLELEFDDSLL